MKPHVKNYLEYHGLTEGDFLACEVCGKGGIIPDGIEIHHIVYRSHGGTDDPENTIALCCGNVSCHKKAHNGELSKEFLRSCKK